MHWLISATGLIFVVVGAATAAPIERQQIRVSDGDTVWIDGESVRLLGFDTPETQVGFYRCDVERERGLVAKKRLEEILDTARAIDIRFRKHRDRYNRLLGRLSLDGRDVGKILISEGLAVRYRGSGPKMDWCPRRRRG
ncbi:MAG: hypothetical protein GEU95_04135 [Rhizobiales bacterium]|nr:hypothetical protein [Hyphomicrobiales bacterium]